MAIWWYESKRQKTEKLPAIRQSMGRFRFHWTRSQRLPRGLRELWDLVFFVVYGLWRALRGGNYDAVVCYGVHRTGIAAVLLKSLLRVPLIIEVPGNPREAQKHHHGFWGSVKKKIGPWLSGFVLRNADTVRLLYPDQLGSSRELLPEWTVTTFHEFVPVTEIRRIQAPAPAATDRPYLLFLGFPWFLKGVDILIKAFNNVADEFPEVRLRIIGFCPDPQPFLDLRGDNERIEFLPPVPHHRAMQEMAGCLAFVLPSRTEAMGRVLLEAMALGKPVVASAVDGIPHYVTDGENGLLFPKEDVDALANQLRVILSSEDVRARLGNAGLDRVMKCYSETAYVDRYARVLNRLVESTTSRSVSGN